MGATDVLPYPRRRSSIQLEPINFRLPGEVEGPSNLYKTVLNQMNRFSVEDRDRSHSSLPPKSPPVLQPLRVLPRHALAREQTRSQSSECLFRTRSHSMHRTDRPHVAETRRASGLNERPHEARRRIASDNDENTAQFIEKLRRDLSSQVHRPHEFEIIHRPSL
ncbi:hypothetical protein Y032_0219g2478 [Ancylostoma ceylanicum]|nr:hypothetical protein Y032_0219g2478 [Ancylostoma ceylanicum]